MPPRPIHPLRVGISITDLELLSFKNEDELEGYVKRLLSERISGEIIKHMTINSTKMPNNGVTHYTGSINVIDTNSTTTSTNAYYPDLQINLRVVEYTKNGKITRVELQRYDDTYSDWIKIPRINIEE